MTIPAPAFQLPPDVQPATPPPSFAHPVTPTETPVIPMDHMAQMYRKLRDKKEEIAARHASELKPIREVMDQLEGLMQKQLNAQNATSVRTEHGTVIASTRSSFTVDDPEAFNAWCDANNAHYLKENRASKEAIQEYVAKGNPLPPGIKASSVSTITVRK